MAISSPSLDCQLRCGSSRMRAPLAPPRLSVPRKLDAEAQAVRTSCGTVSPVARIASLSEATSASETSAPSTVGTGSCHGWGSGTHGPRYRSTGPMSRCSSLYQAFANASANSSGCSRKRREIFSYSGSRRRARSVVSMVGGRLSEPSSGSGTVFAPAPSLGCHWCAPAGLLVSSHSKPKRFSKNLLLHRVGVWVQVTSIPLVMASRPLPEPCALFQPMPWCSTGQPSGSGPTRSGLPAPWVLPNECPPAMSATVSSSFIAIRANVSRMSRAALTGSGTPLGPSGLT